MVLSPQGYMIEISSMQQLENFNSSTTRSYLAAVLMYDNIMVVLEFYIASDRIQDILITQLRVWENWRNTVGLARTYREILSKFWEIGFSIWTDGRRPEVRIDPNFEEFRQYFPICPSQTYGIHIVINLIRAFNENPWIKKPHAFFNTWGIFTNKKPHVFFNTWGILIVKFF